MKIKIYTYNWNIKKILFLDLRESKTDKLENFGLSCTPALQTCSSRQERQQNRQTLFIFFLANETKQTNLSIVLDSRSQRKWQGKIFVYSYHYMKVWTSIPRLILGYICPDDVADPGPLDLPLADVSECCWHQHVTDPVALDLPRQQGKYAPVLTGA